MKEKKKENFKKRKNTAQKDFDADRGELFTIACKII